MESPPEGITVELANESDFYQWKVYMEGPEGSPYHVCVYYKRRAATVLR
jgi:ubiquitin-protein ligase